ncbi:PGBD4 [Branchiostoma lanceolatum]|uniref:PGBD4 protein n=1 Tax=Branchiostoma lanceolatum TaxID=7740 RepID=A0A8J9VRK3_BRALA|nr:PGBD4 [Branchiostoma lanceolatum]
MFFALDVILTISMWGVTTIVGVRVTQKIVLLQGEGDDLAWNLNVQLPVESLMAQVALGVEAGVEVAGVEEARQQGDVALGLHGGVDVADVALAGEVRFSDAPTPLEFLNLMVPDSFYQTCTEQTNKYASDYFAVHPKASHPPGSRVHRWPDEGITEAEMRTFLALTIAMGILPHQDVQDYWSTDEVMQTPFFPSIMTRNRFLLIFRFFHLSDNDTYRPRGHPEYNPLHKLGTIYETLVEKFKTTWYPGQQICIDEGMVPFRGNIHFRTYNPDKPDKYGLKAYQLCDSQNGYCCQFQLYGGKGKEPSAKGMTHDIVSQLVEPYLQKGHTLYCDNYYTSPQLFLDLSDGGMNACGTMRNRKGIPKEFKDAKLKTPGEKLCMANDPLLGMKYRDRRDVKMLSTAHSAKMVSTDRNNHRGELIMKPECIHEYNQYMGAVDSSDQMVAYLCFRRRTVKWWKKAFFHMMSLAIVNAHLLQKEYMTARGKKGLEHKEFRREVVKEIIKTSGYNKPGSGKSGRPLSSNPGFDRLMAILCKADSISDFIAFPKSGNDPMSGTLSSLTDAELQPFHVKVQSESSRDV